MAAHCSINGSVRCKAVVGQEYSLGYLTMLQFHIFAIEANIAKGGEVFLCTYKLWNILYVLCIKAGLLLDGIFETCFLVYVPTKDILNIFLSLPTFL